MHVHVQGRFFFPSENHCFSEGKKTLCLEKKKKKPRGIEEGPRRMVLQVACTMGVEQHSTCDKRRPAIRDGLFPSYSLIEPTALFGGWLL